MGRMRELENLRTERARMAAPLGKSARMETTAVEGGGQMVLEAIDLTVSVPMRATPRASAAGTDARRVLFNHFNGIIRKGDRSALSAPTVLANQHW